MQKRKTKKQASQGRASSPSKPQNHKPSSLRSPSLPYVQTSPSQPLSKHKKRALRRAQYFEMIDKEMNHEKHFKGRVIDTLNHDGIDIGPDGRPIKANWWRYMDSRQKSRRVYAEACLYLVQGAIHGIRPELI